MPAQKRQLVRFAMGCVLSFATARAYQRIGSAQLPPSSHTFFLVSMFDTPLLIADAATAPAALLCVEKLMVLSFTVRLRKPAFCRMRTSTDDAPGNWFLSMTNSGVGFPTASVCQRSTLSGFA